MKVKIYNIPVYTAYLDMIVKNIISDSKVKYIFTPSVDTFQQYFACGEYCIMIPYDCKVDTTIIEEYRQRIFDSETFDKLIKSYEYTIADLKDNNKSFKYIDERFHKQIETEFDNRLETKRKEWANDIICSYRDLFDKYINSEVKRYKDNFLKKFYYEECPYDKLCELYKNIINSEINLRLEEIIERIINNCPKYHPGNYLFVEGYNNEVKKKILIEVRHELDKYDWTVNEVEIEKKLKKFKNDIVDRILKMWDIKQGTREYYIAFKGAGKLADLLEISLWRFYDLGKSKQVEYKNE